MALTSDGRLFASLDKWWLVSLYAVGLGALLVAAGFSAAVVVPRLRTTKAGPEARHNFIYFGHARLWEPSDLERALTERPILPQLSRQIVVMARIAWTKHLRVQWSFSLAVVGSACLVACGLLKVLS